MTLIELLIAMTVSLIIFASVFEAYTFFENINNQVSDVARENYQLSNIKDIILENKDNAYYIVDDKMMLNGNVVYSNIEGENIYIEYYCKEDFKDLELLNKYKLNGNLKYEGDDNYLRCKIKIANDEIKFIVKEIIPED